MATATPTQGTIDRVAAGEVRYVAGTEGAGVRVRDACANGAPGEGALPEGTRLTIEYERADCPGWFYARHGDTGTWVRADYLSSTAPQPAPTTAPSATSSATTAVEMPAPTPTNGPTSTATPTPLAPRPTATDVDMPETPDYVETYIAGEFIGWNPHTSFHLGNGQVWRQISYFTAPYRLDQPRVVIRRTAAGYLMEVDGTFEATYVERVR